MEQDEFDSLADGSWKYEIESLRQQLAECERERDELVTALKKTREAVITMRNHAEEYGKAYARAYVKEYRDMLPGSAKEQFDLLGIMHERLNAVSDGLIVSYDALAKVGADKEET